MKTLKEQVEGLRAVGYDVETAAAKVAHDVILLAIGRSGLKANSTVKGGLVMSNLTQDIRRATMDMDIAFVHKRLSDDSVKAFINKLQRFLPGVRLAIRGTITELRHDNYRGKQIYVTVKDDSLPRPLITKMDIGVHARNNVAQENVVFSITADDAGVDLNANGPEQIFIEKLLSILRFGILTNRPKDIFDMYYLREKLNPQKMSAYMQIMVYGNRRCKVKNKSELLLAVMPIFASPLFVSRIRRSRSNWLRMDVREALRGILAYLQTI